jgi:hypothetical protein
MDFPSQPHSKRIHLTQTFCLITNYFSLPKEGYLNEETTDDPDYPFQSTINFTASQFLETGYYQCTDEENVNLINSARVAKIYIYVDGRFLAPRNQIQDVIILFVPFANILQTNKI